MNEPEKMSTYQNLWEEQVARLETEAEGKNSKALALIFQKLMDTELTRDNQILDRNRKAEETGNREWQNTLRRVAGNFMPKTEDQTPYQLLREKAEKEGIFS